MTDELDEILNIHTIDAGNRVLKLIDVNEAKQAIQAFIDRECTKARIEELEEVIKRNNYGMTKSQLGTLDRIKEIKRSKE